MVVKNTGDSWTEQRWIEVVRREDGKGDGIVDWEAMALDSGLCGESLKGGRLDGKRSVTDRGDCPKGRER